MIRYYLIHDNLIYKIKLLSDYRTWLEFVNVTVRMLRLTSSSQFAVLVNVGLGIPAAIYWGATGMALATVASQLTKNAIVFILLRREFPVRYPWGTSLRFALAGAAVGILLWWLNGLVPFLAAGVVGAVAWLVALRLFRVLNEDERQLLVTIVPTRFQRITGLLIGH